MRKTSKINNSKRRGVVDDGGKFMEFVRRQVREMDRRFLDVLGQLDAMIAREN